MKKEIEIVFENCEYLTVTGDIEFDVISDRKDGKKDIDNVKIVIPKSENGVHDFWGSGRDDTKFNRIGGKDITQLEFDGVTHFPAWYEEGEYCSSQYNEYQKTHRDNDGNMIVSISKANKEKPTQHSKILELMNTYWNLEENQDMTFGNIVDEIMCRLTYDGVINADDKLIIDVLEDMIVECV